MKSTTDFDLKAAMAGLKPEDLNELLAKVGFSETKLADALYAIATEPNTVEAMVRAHLIFGPRGHLAFRLLHTD